MFSKNLKYYRLKSSMSKKELARTEIISYNGQKIKSNGELLTNGAPDKELSLEY